MKKVLLLNPPGDELYLRDYFCSKISKSGYLYHPTDLLTLSGAMSQRFEVHVCDAIAEKRSYDGCLRDVRDLAPDFLVFITGSVSFGKDMDFIQTLRAETPSIQKVMGIGDIFFEKPHQKLERFPFLDAIVYDFTTDAPVRFLAGEPCTNIVHRKNGEISGQWDKPRNAEFSIPVPRYDLFPNKAYNYPFCRKKPFAVMLTNFGCPFQCSFCIMPSLGFKVRDVENLLQELRYLKQNGFKNIYFNDQTFAAHKRKTRQLLEAMINEGLNSMGWVCFSRVDVLDEELIQLMRKAGCHTIMFGVESADESILNQYQKNITPDLVRERVTQCKKHGIRTLGTFILGLPGETRETALKTIAFAKNIPLDYAAFNIAIPRMGTGLRDRAVSENLVAEDMEEMDQSGAQAVLETETMSPRAVEALQRKAYREFYFRPGKLLGKVLDIRTTHDLMNHVRNGWGVFMGLFSRS